VWKKYYWFGNNYRENATRKILVSTWNVKELKTHVGKLSLMEMELTRYNIKIAGKNLLWFGEGHSKTYNGNYIYFSGSEQQEFTKVVILIT
jgi:hypothetical protein